MEIIAPVAGASSSSQVKYPLKNTEVYRPGQTTVDANGKKITTTGQVFNALYNGTYAEAIEIKNTKLRTPNDQNYLKTLMYKQVCMETSKSSRPLSGVLQTQQHLLTY